jgi:hypothetical protein
MPLRDHALKISETSAAKTGLAISVILPIIEMFLPMLMNMPCLQGQPAKEVLQDHYDANTDTFDSQAIKRARPAMRRSARRNGQGGLSKPDLDIMTVEAFGRGLDSSDQDVSSAQAEAKLVPNVEVIDG